MFEKYLKGNLKVLIILFLIIIFVVALLLLLKTNREQKDLVTSAAGSALIGSDKEFKYTDINGNDILLKDYLGQVLVVNSWASWSPFSADELIELSQVAGEFSNEQVKVLAINRAEPGTTAERYLSTINSSQNILLVLDAEDNFYKSISGYAMPETVFYDAKGNIVHHNRGPLKADEVRNYIKQALESVE